MTSNKQTKVAVQMQNMMTEALKLKALRCSNSGIAYIDLCCTETQGSLDQGLNKTKDDAGIIFSVKGYIH
jgi:hypothetical protein